MDKHPSGFVTFAFHGLHLTMNPMAVVLVMILGVFAFILWKGQRQEGQNTFDVFDLVMDRMEDGKRIASGIKVAFQAAFILSSWVVVDSQLKGTLTEGIFGLYLATWCASLIAKVVFDKKDAPEFPMARKLHDGE